MGSGKGREVIDFDGEQQRSKREPAETFGGLRQVDCKLALMGRKPNSRSTLVQREPRFSCGKPTRSKHASTRAVTAGPGDHCKALWMLHSTTPGSYPVSTEVTCRLVLGGAGPITLIT